MAQSNDPDETPDLVLRVLHGIASVALVVMMLVVVADVVLRFAFDMPVRGAYDMVGIALLIMVFCGIGPVIARRGEILIDLVDTILPARALGILRLCATIGTVGVFLFVGWAMIGPGLDAYRYGDRSLELGLPVWGQWVCAFVGLGGILWAALRRLVAELRKLDMKR